MKKMLVFVAALVFMVSQVPAATLIDHFEYPASDDQGNVVFSESAVGTYTASQGPGLTGVVGGQRDFELNITTASSGSSTVVVQFSNGGIHLLSYDNGSGVQSDLKLTYDAGGAGLGLDLSGDSAFTFRVNYADFGGSADVTLTDGTSTSVTKNVSFPATGGPITVSEPLSSFAGLVLSDIDKIEVKFLGPLSWDIKVDSIETTTLVPEPASLLLLGLGAVPLIRRLRRS